MDRSPFTVHFASRVTHGGLAWHTLTLGIVKPDAVAGGKTGKIVAHLEQAGFVLRAARLVRLTQAQAGAFYEVHRGPPFYDELVEFMTSGPCLPHGAGAGGCRGASAHGHRRHRSGRGRGRHDPEALRRVEGQERDPRLRQPGQRRPGGRASSSARGSWRVSGGNCGSVASVGLLQVVVPITLTGYAASGHPGPAAGPRQDGRRAPARTIRPSRGWGSTWSDR